MKSNAIYPGSFDPFTNGHLGIVKKASRLFDTLYIVISINSSKKRSYSEESMAIAIRQTLEAEGLTNCKVCVHDGLVAEFAAEVNAEYMIRGLRNNMDYNYEENLAEINKLLNPKLEYVYFRSDNVAVSSTMVKELVNYHKDLSPFVPEQVLRVLHNP